MKRSRIAEKSFLVSILALVLFAGGCENFMKDDNSFKLKLKEDVVIANTPEIEIRVEAAQNTGTTAPNGPYRVKPGVPFTIIFYDDDSIGFIRWAAYSSTNFDTPLEGVVSFENLQSLETKATLLVAKNNIVIRPICERRPTVEDYEPADKSDVVRNYPIKIYFDKPIDPESFIFGQNEDGSNRYRNTVDGIDSFKNISIKGREDYGNNSSVSFENYYLDPVLSEDGLTLLIDPNPDSLPINGSYIYVTINKFITDTSGLNMEDEYKWRFSVTGSDSTPPSVTTVKAGRDADNFFSNSLPTADRRIGSNPLIIAVKAVDFMNISRVEFIKVTETHTHFANGTAVSSPVSTTLRLPYRESPVDGESLYLFEYQPVTTGDGVVTLSFQAIDSSKNESSLATAPAYAFIRDTTPPLATNVSAISIGGQTTGGYFNGGNNKEIHFDPDDVIDSGFAGNASVPRTRSSIVEWDFSFGNSTSFANDWELTDDIRNMEIPTSVPDGDVSVYVRFRDDLDNTTEPLLLPNIRKDSTVPSGSVTVTGSTLIAGIQMIGTNSIPVSISGTDNLSGVSHYYLSASDELPATPVWKAYSNGVTDTVTVASTDGAKNVYLWLKDAADNVSTRKTNAVSVILDTQDPIISDFFINKTAATATTALQLTNQNTLFFGFTATDAGAGVGRFSLSEGASTDWFNTGTGEVISAQAGTRFTVQDVKRTTVSPGVYLVSGKIVLSAGENERTIVLRVRDLVRPTTSSAPRTANRVIFDTIAPSLSVSMNVNANPAFKYYTAGEKYFVNNAAQTLKITASDLPAGSEKVSGINYVQVSGNISPVANISFSTGSENAGAVGERDQAVNLTSANGRKALSFMALDYAGNQRLLQRDWYLDTIAPTSTISLYRTATDPTPFVGPSSAPDTYASAGSANRDISSLSLLVSAADPDVANASGVAAGSVHTWKLYRENLASTRLDTGVSGTFASGSHTPITLPVDPTLTRPLSGRYVVGVKVRDNLHNTSAEQFAGYTYDETPPQLSSLTVTNYTSGLPAVRKNNTVFVNDVEGLFYLDAEATDRPTVDPNGTGITTVYVKHGVDSDFPLLTEPLTYHAGSSIEGTTIPAETQNETGKIRIYKKDTMLKPYWTALGTNVLFEVSVQDQVGNTSVSLKSLRVVHDSYAPTIDLDSLGGSVGYDPEKKYLANFTFIPNDGSTAGNYTVPSGVKAWAVTSSSTSPVDSGPAYNDNDATYTSAWSSYSGSWNRYVSGAVNATSNLSALFTGGATNKYLHLLDIAGNARSIDIPTNIVLDEVAPQFPAVDPDTRKTKLLVVDSNGNEIGKSIINPTYGYLHFIRQETFSLRLYTTDRSAASPNGSGIKQVQARVVQDSGESYQGVATVTEYDNNNNNNTPENRWVTLPHNGNIASTSFMGISAIVTDNVGHTAYSHGTDFTMASTGNALFKIVLDKTAPVVFEEVRDIVTGTVDNDGVRYTKNPLLSFTAVDNPSVSSDLKTSIAASGVSHWMLSTSATKPEADDPGWSEYSLPVANSTKIVELINDPEVTEAIPVYLYLKDKAGNISSGIDLGSFRIDNTPPAVEEDMITRATVYGNENPRYVNAAVAASFTATDVDGSGLSKFFISTNATETAATIEANGTTYADQSGLPLSSYFSTTVGRRLYIHFTDKLQNVLSVELTNGYPVLLDTTAPVLSSIVINPGAGVEWIKTPTVTVRVNHGGGDASGIEIIVISGNVADHDAAALSAITLTRGPTNIATPFTPSFDDIKKELTLTITDPYKNNNYFTIGNVRLSMTSDSATISTVLTDLVENNSASASATVKTDAELPSVTAVTLRDSATNSDSWATARVNAELTFTETKSGLASITVGGSGLNATPFTSPEVVHNGDIYSLTSVPALTVSGSKIFLPVPLKSTDNATLRINGINITTGDGSKPLTFLLEDKVENEQETAFTKSINRDTANTSTPVLLLASTSGIYPSSISATHYVTSSISLTLTGGEPVSLPAQSGHDRYVYSINGAGEYAVIGSSITLSPTTDDTYVFYSYDQAGNRSASGASVRVIKDIVGATITSITSPNSGEAYPRNMAATSFFVKGTGAYAFTPAITISGAPIKGYNLDGTTATPYTTTVSLSASGSPQTVYAVDQLGNISAGFEVTVTRDSTPPVTASLTVTSSEGGYATGTDSPITLYYTTSGQELTLTPIGATDSGAGNSGLAGYSVNSDGTNANTTITLSPATGTPSSVFYVVDRVGNTTAITVDYKPDLLAPEIIDLAESESQTHLFYNGSEWKAYSRSAGTAITITPTASDHLGGSGIKGYGLTSGSTPTSTVDLTTTGNIFVFDNVGRSASTPVTYTVDSDPPNVTNLTASVAGGGYYRRDSATAATLFYKTAGVPLTVTPNPASVSDTASGVAGYRTATTGAVSTFVTYTPTVDATVSLYAADNVDRNAEVQVSLRLDVIGPAGFALRSPNNPEVYPRNATATTFYVQGDTEYIFTPSVADATAPVAGYNLDGTDSLAYSTSIPLAASATTYSVYAVDVLGNVSGPHSITVTQDTTPPDVAAITMTSTTGGFSTGTGSPLTLFYKTSGTALTLTPTGATDSAVGDSGIAGYTANSDGSGAAATISLSPDTDTPSGEFYAVDNVGRVTPITVTYTYDNVGPTISSLTESHAEMHLKDNGNGTWNSYTRGNGTEITITPVATDNIGGSGLTGFGPLQTSTPDTTVKLTANGTVFAFDNVGNYSSVSVVYGVDGVAPVQNNVTATVTGGGFYRRDSNTTATLFYKTAGVELTVTPTGATDSASGIAGYRFGSSGEYLSVLKITPSGNTTLTVLDNVGRVSGTIIVTVTQDTTAPVITTGSLNGWGEGINNINTPTDAASGVKTSTYASSTGTFTGTQVTGLSAMTVTGSETITISVEDNVGNKVSLPLTRAFNSGTSQYTITAGTPVNSSIRFGGIVPEGGAKRGVLIVDYQTPAPEAFASSAPYVPVSWPVPAQQTEQTPVPESVTRTVAERHAASTAEAAGTVATSSAPTERLSVLDLHNKALRRTEVVRESRVEITKPEETTVVGPEVTADSEPTQTGTETEEKGTVPDGNTLPDPNRPLYCLLTVEKRKENDENGEES